MLNAVNEILGGLFRRVGTMTGSAAVTYGATADQSAMIASSVFALLAVASELALSHYLDRR